MATLTLPLRTLHVLGAGVLIGAAATLWYAFRPVAEGEVVTGHSIRLARAYEWTFWAIIAVLIVSGIGNVAAYGRGIPGPASEWGLVLAVKLIGVVGLLVLSVVRSLLVDRATSQGAAGVESSDRGSEADRDAILAHRLRGIYALTGLYVAGIVVLAEVLAHG
jgi:uncharacterized membrane protein